MPRGFFGTRADLFMDVAIVFFTLLPIAVALGIRAARRRRHDTHRKIQAWTLAIVFAAIVLFELDIRLSGGTGAFLAESGMDATFVRNFLRAHVAVAIVTAIGWIVLAIRSWKKYGAALPGVYSRRHRFAGWLTFIGVCLLSSSGCALYIFLFVM